MTRLRRFATALAVVLLLVISTTPLIAAADLPGDARGTLAAVFAPGAVVRGGGWDSVLVVHSQESGFARRLRQAGAWLVVDPQSAAGCLIAYQSNAS